MLASTCVGAANSSRAASAPEPVSPNRRTSSSPNELPDTTAVERMLIGSTAMNSFDATASERSITRSSTSSLTYRPAKVASSRRRVSSTREASARGVVEDTMRP